MLSQCYAEEDANAALCKMVAVHREHDFLSTDMRQTVQRWVDLNGGGSSALDKGHVKAIKNIRSPDVPVKWWDLVRKSLGHNWHRGFGGGGRNDMPPVHCTARRGARLLQHAVLA